MVIVHAPLGISQRPIKSVATPYLLWIHAIYFRLTTLLSDGPKWVLYGRGVIELLECLLS